MSLQSKLLDLTCTHANTLHATDCKDCIQLVNDITQLFIEEGWVEMLGRPDFVDNYVNQRIKSVLDELEGELKDYEPHRIGMHSDDWGGSSDKPCFCELTSTIQKIRSRYE